jgi:hypothetical protein
LVALHSWAATGRTAKRNRDKRVKRNVVECIVTFVEVKDKKNEELSAR